MKIGILVTSISNFGEKGFYNSQEIGLAKALTAFFDEVEVFKLITADGNAATEVIEGCENGKTAVLHMIPARNFGINGILDVNALTTSLDVLVYFSDTQLSLPAVYRWAQKNNVRFLPYIGVAESHSTNFVKKIIIDVLFGRNLSVYRKCRCLVKTPSVAKALAEHGVESTSVAPVGLDLSLLREDYINYSPEELKGKYGYGNSDRVLLFIGRLIEEKQPVRMIEILAEAVKHDKNYKLLMVGTGELREAVDQAIDDYGVRDKVQFVDRIPNSDIWELYRFADCFVNLNQQEIFGMAILEAMYYGCKVVAWTAPGPDFIIEDGVSGCICEDNESLIDAVVNQHISPEAAHSRVIGHFTWDNTARVIAEKIESTGQ